MSDKPFKICRCKHPATGKPLGNKCPRLRRANRSWNPDHGQWSYQLELPPTMQGRRRQLRPTTGLPTQADAQQELEQARQLLRLAAGNRKRLIEIADLMQAARRTDGVLPDVDTVRQRLGTGNPLAAVPSLAEYLTAWITEVDVDENTRRTYESHIRVHLVPHLGEVPLDQLRPHHVQLLIRKIKERNADLRAKKDSPDADVRQSVAGMRPTGEATRARIRATLRKAFNDALLMGVVAGIANPAALVKTPNPRARAIVWEPERVERWRATGIVPGKVMVWTAETATEFLDYAAEQAPDLYPLLHFVAYRGARRGEACGLLDAEVRLQKAEAGIVEQIATHGQRPVRKKPKSETGVRDLVLDAVTVGVLHRYKAMRAQWQLAAGPAWPDTGLFFVRPDGHAWHPNSVSQRFRRLVKRGGFPPIRFYDLRHVAATIALEAGVDIKVVSEQLGHSTTTLTRDTYQSVVKSLHRDAADAVAATMQGKRKTA